jgi:dephospho-CoA kinase
LFSESLSRQGHSNVFIVGLTGGIGSGKSTVADLFRQQGVPIIDADAIGHQLVSPGQPCLDAIVTAFGDTVLNSDGTLDRDQLRQQVFNSPEKRRELENIMHPAIRDAMRQQAQQFAAPYAIFVIPLLLEAGQQQMVDRILVVDCSEEQQIQRVRQRDHLDTAQIRAIMAAQVDRETRLAAADDVVINSGSREALAQAVLQLHQRYLSLGQA